MGRSDPIPEKGLTKKQLDAVVLILEGSSLTAAARKLRVGKSSVYRWLKLPAVKEALEAGRRAIFSEAIGQLKAASGKAVKKLVDVMRSDDEAEARRAATTILELGFRAKELDEFEARILALEVRGPGGGEVYELSERFLPVVVDRLSIGTLKARARCVKKSDARASQ